MDKYDSEIVTVGLDFNGTSTATCKITSRFEQVHQIVVQNIAYFFNNTEGLVSGVYSNIVDNNCIGLILDGQNMHYSPTTFNFKNGKSINGVYEFQAIEDISNIKTYINMGGKCFIQFEFRHYHKL